MKIIFSFSILLFSVHAFSDTSIVWQSITELQKRIAADKAQVEKLMMSGFTDKFNGLSWSVNLPGQYTNGCIGYSKEKPCSLVPSKNVGERPNVGEDSEAQMACRKLGGRLPTYRDFRSLLNNFRVPNIGDNNIEDGYLDMEKLRSVFGNGKFNEINSWYSSEQYWTSSVDLDWDPRGLTTVAIGFWNTSERLLRQGTHMVRCIFEPK